MRLDPAVAATRLAVRRVLADLPPDELVLVALSGGADSTALAAALAWEAPRQRRCAGAVVVDHGLQPGSAAVAAGAAGWARAVGLTPVRVLRAEVGTGPGPEAAARAARYAALEAAARQAHAGAVLLGHTLDDQAETVLLRLARGSGARSLAGMAPLEGRYRRPFLSLRRSTTRAACRALGLATWDDPHNDDRRFTRVRVRADALPALAAALGAGVPGALARTATQLRDDAEALEAWAERATTDRVAELAALPRAVRTRVLRRWALAAGVPAGALGSVHVDALDRLVTDWHGQGPVCLPAGVQARRSCGRLHADGRRSASPGG